MLLLLPVAVATHRGFLFDDPKAIHSSNAYLFNRALYASYMYTLTTVFKSWKYSSTSEWISRFTCHIHFTWNASNTTTVRASSFPRSSVSAGPQVAEILPLGTSRAQHGRIPQTGQRRVTKERPLVVTHLNHRIHYRCTIFNLPAIRNQTYEHTKSNCFICQYGVRFEQICVHIFFLVIRWRDEERASDIEKHRPID